MYFTKFMNSPVFTISEIEDTMICWWRIGLRIERNNQDEHIWEELYIFGREIIENCSCTSLQLRKVCLRVLTKMYALLIQIDTKSYSETLVLFIWIIYMYVSFSKCTIFYFFSYLICFLLSILGPTLLLSRSTKRMWKKFRSILS